MAAPVLLTPEVISSGIGAIGSFGSSILNGLFNRDSMANQVEHAKDLMKYQWENFQSPQAQVRALAAAGLNPAVALGHGGIGFSASPSVNMPSSTPPQIGGVQDIASFVKAMAEAKKAGLESTAQEMQNDLTRQTFGELVRKVGLENKWKESDIIKMDNEVSKLVADVHQIEKNVLLNDKQIKWFDRIQSAQVEDLKQSAAYHEALSKLTDEQKNLLDSTMEDLKNYAHYNTEQLQKMVELLGKYGDAQAIVGMISQVVSSASDLIGNFVPAKQIKHVVENVTHPAK